MQPDLQPAPLLVGLDGSLLFALDRRTGAAAWHHALPGVDARAGRVVVEGPYVVVAAQNVHAREGTSLWSGLTSAFSQPRAGLFCFEYLTGRFRWCAAFGPATQQSLPPTLLVDAGQVLVGVGMEHSSHTTNEVHAYALATGAALWSSPLAGRGSWGVALALPGKDAQTDRR